MKNSTLLKVYSLLFVLMMISKSQAQVEDLSFTISPTTEYVWWDDKAGLGNDLLFGGTVGFGFGEFLELRGVFQTSRELSTNFSSYGLDNYSNTAFESQNVNLNRYGGELKVNFSNRNFSPYFTLGTGIQSLKVEGNSSFEQIYASAGLGLRFAISDRLNFLIEGRALGFNINAPNNLLTPANQQDFNVNTSNFSRDQALNFSAMAGLQVYLGGRAPGELSSLDKAYLENYKGGFKGWSWVIEPSLAYINFDSKSLYRDTWMAGGYAGLDFTEYVGVRGFYYQGTNEVLGVDDLDRLNMYGLEFRAKLNDGRGVNPYLMFGGGYLNTQSGYQGSLPTLGAQSTAFANAGLGLDIPLGQNILVTGGARAMATSSRDVSDLVGPDVLQTHVMFNVGIKIQLGKRLRPQDNAFILEEQAEFNANNASANSEEYSRLQQLKKDYNQQLMELDEEYKEAYWRNDTKKAVDILEEKKKINTNLREIENLERLYNSGGNEDSGQYLKMTPEEFEGLIDRILKGIDEKYEENTKASQKKTNENALMLNLFKRIENLEEEQTKTVQKEQKSVPNAEKSSTTSKDETAIKEREVEQKNQEEVMKMLEENTEEQKQMLKTLEEKAEQQEAIQQEIKSKTEEQKRLEKEIKQKLKEQEKLQKDLDKKAKEQEQKRLENERELQKAQEEIKRLEKEAREKARDTVN